MSKLIYKKIESCNDKLKLQIDEFILDRKTNGEFINTIKYLEYHPISRFVDDSIVVLDENSGSIRGVMMAASVPGDNGRVISHPGTTFAGPIINVRASVKEKLEVIMIICNYYEKSYQQVELKTLPSIYGAQSFGTVDYVLLQNRYIYKMQALSNVINISEVHSEEDILLLYAATKRNHTKKVIKSNAFVFKESEIILPNVWEQMNNNLNAKFAMKSTHTFEEICQLHMKFPVNIKPYYVFSASGDYAAFALVFKFKNVFHTQYLDINYKYTGQYPNLLLIYNLIRIASKEGYQWFSFGASTDKGAINQGLYNYKAGYGSGDVVMPVFQKNIL